MSEIHSSVVVDAFSSTSTVAAVTAAAAAAASSSSAAPPAPNSPMYRTGGGGSANESNWTSMDCLWLDEVHNIQNHLYWRQNSPVLLLSLYAVVCTFGTVVNLFVLLSFARVSQLRNLHNYFIANLAVSDLLLCTVTAPMTLYLSMNFFWPFGTPACQIISSIQAVNMLVSCLTLVLIAMDRFLLTLFPVKWRLAAKAPLFCYLFAWFCSIVVAAPYGAAVSVEDATILDPWNTPHVKHLLIVCAHPRPQICMENTDTWARLPFSRRNYTLFVLAIQYILPLSALAIAYTQIGSTIRKRVKMSTTVDGDRKQSMAKRNRKALLLLSCLVIVYAVAWAPMHAYNVLHVLEAINFSQYQYLFCHLIGMTSACLNPLLYALINDSFRAAFLQLIRPLLLPCTSVVVEQQRTTLINNNNNNHLAQHHTFSSAMPNRKTLTTAIDSSHPSKVLRGRSPVTNEASFSALFGVTNGGSTARHATLATSAAAVSSAPGGGSGDETTRLLEPGGGGVAETSMRLLSPSPTPSSLIRVRVEEECRTRVRQSMPSTVMPDDHQWRWTLLDNNGGGNRRMNEEDEEEEDGRTTNL